MASADIGGIGNTALTDRVGIESAVVASDLPEGSAVYASPLREVHIAEWTLNAHVVDATCGVTLQVAEAPSATHMLHEIILHVATHMLHEIILHECRAHASRGHST